MIAAAAETLHNLHSVATGGAISLDHLYYFCRSGIVVWIGDDHLAVWKIVESREQLPHASATGRSDNVAG